ncbi:sigma-70 family RNA polymerase sigma factor [Pacificoceanicola onchidii]|uniref:sigma-70 family RNA polymerase sigma factor n=1 Tax=Pacificoceanicola onchidii TaxID=2562685 RepID=UPI0010A44D79|nr:sigma-70 family RNA polymerase sigma factor [Pacificoceanicola onchidii]
MVLEDDMDRLMSRVAMADRQAFAKLYTHTAPALFAVALQVLKTDAEAEEVLQEVYLRVWQRAGQYRGDGLAPMAWLISLTRDAAVDKRRTDTHSGGHPPLPDEGAFEQDAGLRGAQSEAALRFRQCLSKLPGDHATALRRAYLHGAGYAALAEPTGRAAGDLRNGLGQSLKQLKVCLGG